MKEVKEVSAKVDETLHVAQSSLTQESSDSYEMFSIHVQQLYNLAREAFQAKLRDASEELLGKLEAGEPLSAGEWDTVKLFIIGDAQYYVKYENDVENWRSELKRLVSEVQKVRAKGLDDVDTLLHLKAACRDALKVLPDITFYFREKERVERFESGTAGRTDRVAGQFLADFIRYALQSDRL